MKLSRRGSLAVPFMTLGYMAFLPAVAPAGEALLPDIQEQVPDHLQVQNEHQREMLRFSTSHINLGAGPLQIRGGGQVAPCVLGGISYDQCTYATQEILDASGQVVATHPAGVAIFHPEHNHWHQSSVATFEVRQNTLDGPVLALGEKVTFCLIDFEKVESIANNAKPVYWECNADLQGLSVGYIDEYHQSTPGQELDITGVPTGIYYLTHIADPDQHWLELSETNNQAWVKFELKRQGSNAKVTVLDHSPCEGATCGNTANK